MYLPPPHRSFSNIPGQVQATVRRDDLSLLGTEAGGHWNLGQAKAYTYSYMTTIEVCVVTMSWNKDSNSQEIKKKSQQKVLGFNIYIF